MDTPEDHLATISRRLDEITELLSTHLTTSREQSAAQARALRSIAIQLETIAARLHDTVAEWPLRRQH